MSEGTMLMRLVVVLETTGGIATAASMAASAASARLAPPGPVVAVAVPGLGRIAGTVSGYAAQVATFRGIPYAEPPTAERRWRPPVPRAPWQPATLNATSYGRSCIQRNQAADADHSEDCLFLNIWAPVDVVEKPTAKLAVLLFIHGGGYNIGSGADNDAVGIVVASGGSVLAVTINYRLGIFGFLGSTEIASTTDGGGSGNFGIGPCAAARWFH